VNWVVEVVLVSAAGSCFHPFFSSLTGIVSCSDDGFSPRFGSGFNNIFQPFDRFRSVLKSFSNYFSVF